MIGSNAAAMCKALEFADRRLRKATEDILLGDNVIYLVGCMRTVAAICRSALAKPPRNCDRFGWRDAWEKWRTENHPQKPVTYKEAYESTAAFMDWFMGTADNGGAA